MQFCKIAFRSKTDAIHLRRIAQNKRPTTTTRGPSTIHLTNNNAPHCECVAETSTQKTTHKHGINIIIISFFSAAFILVTFFLCFASLKFLLLLPLLMRYSLQFQDRPHDWIGYYFYSERERIHWFWAGRE